MSKIHLQDSFKEFCEINKFDINAQQVEIVNSLEKFLNHKETILSRFFKKEEKFFTKGKTKALIEKKYTFNSKNVSYFRNLNKISSQEKSSVEDNNGNI